MDPTTDANLVGARDQEFYALNSVDANENLTHCRGMIADGKDVTASRLRLLRHGKRGEVRIPKRRVPRAHPPAQ